MACKEVCGLNGVKSAEYNSGRCECDFIIRTKEKYNSQSCQRK